MLILIDFFFSLTATSFSFLGFFKHEIAVISSHTGLLSFTAAPLQTLSAWKPTAAWKKGLLSGLKPKMWGIFS